MTTLIEKIKADQLQARKQRLQVESSLLTTLIGDIEMIGKNANRDVTDAEVVETIKKFLKNINITLENLDKFRATANSVAIDQPLAEKKILENLLPKQLTESELVQVVDEILNDMKSRTSSPINMGMVMSALKLGFDGQYDGKMASNIVKKAVL